MGTLYVLPQGAERGVFNRRAKRATFPVAGMQDIGQTLIRIHHETEFLWVTQQFMVNIDRQRYGVSLAPDFNWRFVGVERQREMRLKEHSPSVVEPQINLIVIDRHMNKELSAEKT